MDYLPPNYNHLTTPPAYQIVAERPHGGLKYYVPEYHEVRKYEDKLKLDRSDQRREYTRNRQSQKLNIPRQLRSGRVLTRKTLKPTNQMRTKMIVGAEDLPVIKLPASKNYTQRYIETGTPPAAELEKQVEVVNQSSKLKIPDDLVPVERSSATEPQVNKQIEAKTTTIQEKAAAAAPEMLEIYQMEEKISSQLDKQQANKNGTEMPASNLEKQASTTSKRGSALMNMERYNRNHKIGLKIPFLKKRLKNRRVKKNFNPENIIEEEIEIEAQVEEEQHSAFERIKSKLNIIRQKAADNIMMTTIRHNEEYIIDVAGSKVNFSEYGINRVPISVADQIWLKKARHYFINAREKGIRIGSSPKYTTMPILESLWATAEHFKINQKRFLVQLYNETRFNPNLIGQAGERGLGQFKKMTANHYKYDWHKMKQGNQTYAYQAYAAASFVNKVGESAYNHAGAPGKLYSGAISRRLKKIEKTRVPNLLSSN